MRDHGPDFIGIGVQRAGTSWLYECLRAHPEVFMPTKEIHFFDMHYNRGSHWYSSKFELAPRSMQRGEYTPDYLSHPEAISRIHAYDPTVKLIAILRDPVDRAYSAFQLFKSHGQLGGLSFEQALKVQPNLLTDGFYSKQLDDLFQYFPKRQVHIALFEDIQIDSKTFFKDVCSFLNIDAAFQPASLGSIKNASAFPEMQARLNLPAIQQWLTKSSLGPFVRPLKDTAFFGSLKSRLHEIGKANNKRPDLDDSIRTIITREIESVEARIGRECNAWRSV